MYRVDAAVAVALIVLTACASSAAAGDGRRVEEGGGGEVTNDGRALVVNGTRRMLFSGEMHYTRSTPEVTTSFCILMPFLLCVFVYLLD